jgi:phosphoenolpyruvate-protein kinase (PTS system EI component)
MVLDVKQFLELRRLFNDFVADIPAGPMRHGVMFEVPSACLEARELLQVAEFAAVGTNDLIQYLFAVDRTSAHLAQDDAPEKAVFWSLIGQIAAAAKDKGRPLSVCGEVAGNPRFLPRLIEAGVTTLSVSPRLIAAVRRAAKQVPGVKK